MTVHMQQKEGVADGHTAWCPEDDCRRHRSVARIVPSLYLEVVRRLWRQLADSRRQSISGNIVSHPVTISVRRIRRIGNLITYGYDIMTARVEMTIPLH